MTPHSQTLTPRLFCMMILVAMLAGGCTNTRSSSSTAERAGHAPASADQHAQSPIDIPEQTDAPAHSHEIALHYHKTAEHIIHREHTIELDVDLDDGSGIDFDGQSYVLDQFHFHTPSEHLIGGKRYPVELHLVHRSPQGEVLVVGILFAVGDESLLLEQILSDTPEDLGRIDRDTLLDVSDLFPPKSHFYTYRGSFTTAPYTEGVEWLILRSHPEVSAAQIVRLLVIEGGNARDVQEKNDRTVEEF